jgi:putative acetyltransferase
MGRRTICTHLTLFAVNLLLPAHHSYDSLMIIRIATPEEANTIAKLLRDSFKEFESHYTKEGFAATTPDGSAIAMRMNEGPVWVACDENEILGTVSAVPKGNALYIRSMAVSPRIRKKGIGDSLLRHVESFGRSQGFDRFILSTTPFLLSAIRLYEKFDFQRVDHGPHHLFGTPLFTMEKTLI